MGPLYYILQKTLKNHVKQLARRPLILILYILIALGFVAMIVSTLFIPSNISRKGSVEGYCVIVSGLLIVVVYFGIKRGSSSGGSFFRLADVNMVFTAPISSKKVLIYGFLKQLSTTFFTVLFLTFQIPNIRNNFPIGPYGVLVILAGAFLLMFAMPLIGMLIYSITSVSRDYRVKLEKGLNILVYLLLAGFLAVMLQTRDLMKSAVILLDSVYFYYIPFIGWFKAVFMAAVKGIDRGFYLNLGLIIVSFILMIYVLYKLKTDYYEDVLAATEYKEEIARIKKEGKGTLLSRNIKLRKVHHAYKGTGARSIFNRHMLEYKKMGYLFIDRNTLMIAAIGVASRFFFSGATINSILFFSIYILFFFTVQGKWVQELNKPFIYLVPDSSARKVFYATLSETIKNLVDGIVLFTAAGIMFKADPLTIVLCAVVYMTYGMVYVYGDVLFRRIFGSAHSKNLRLFMKMFLVLFIILPGIAVFMVFNLVLKEVPLIGYYSYLALIIYNILVSLVILLLSRGIFENLEMY